MVVGQFPTDDMGGYGSGAEPSMWDKLGNWASENKDLLAGAAGAYNNYEKQQAANRAQDAINQAAAKWSGFNPSLLSLVKPVTPPNAIDLAATVFQEAPQTWYNLEKLYEARKAAKAGDDSKMEKWRQEQLKAQAQSRIK